jgi:hypothetical protein
MYNVAPQKRSVLFYDETSTSHQLETRRYYHFVGQSYDNFSWNQLQIQNTINVSTKN